MEKFKFNSVVIEVEKNKHIFIFPPQHKSLRTRGGVFPFSGKTPYLFSAHYDRVEGSQGANDNSIAVFHLLDVALKLSQKGVDNWLVVLTDKEELQPGESLEMQGSYTLAKKLKTWGLDKAKIYNFDACGTGGVFIFSTTTDHILKSSDKSGIQNIRSEINQLRDYALETANHLRLDKVLLAPTPFSDDVGFLRAGLAAQTITMLPTEEVEKYEVLLRARPDFVNTIILGKIKDPNERRHLPETWRNLNGPNDIAARLTPEHFESVTRFIMGLVK